TEALFGGAPVDLDGKVSFVPIDAGALVADVFSKVTTCGVYTYYDCWETACDMVINGEVCGCRAPMYTGTERGSLVGYNDNCGDAGTGTNTGNEGGTGGSTGTGGHGGTGQAPTNPDVTSPTPCTSCPPLIDRCKKLNDLIQEDTASDNSVPNIKPTLE